MIDTEELYLDTMRRFLAIYRYVRRYGRQMCAEGLSGRQVAALRRLADAGPCTIGQMRDYLTLNDSSTSELVSQLESEGYVTRSRSTLDNRVVLVALTDPGATLLQQIPLGGIPLLRERLRGLPPQRLERIRGALQDMQRLLDIEDDHR